jgi:GNAT superfamily N-acetyltransferase
MEAPESISLVAVDEGGVVLGVLLGATHPANHVRAMVRRSGLRLAARLAVSAMLQPRLAKDLIITRGRRYARGVTRLLIVRVFPRRVTSPQGADTEVGEITHVFVRPQEQGRGIGRALLDAAVQQARSAGVRELVLVTPPDLAARNFYERLGWHPEGLMRSRSDESFLRFRLFIDDEGSRGPDSSI